MAHILREERHTGYDIPESKIANFLPPDFPRVYDDGRIPLRVQVAQDQQVLHTVLTKPKKGIYMCSHCNVRFSSLAPLLDHIDANDIKRPHTCTYEDCLWKVVGFSKQRQLNRHLKSVHLDAKDQYICSVNSCGKSFGRIDLLNRHVRSIHDNKNSRFNMKLEARRRSSATSTASTTTTYIDSPRSSFAGSGHSSPEFTPMKGSPPLVPLLPKSTSPPTQPSQPTSNSTLTQDPMPSSIGVPDRSQSEPSNKYKHTIEFLTSKES